MPNIKLLLASLVTAAVLVGCGGGGGGGGGGDAQAEAGQPAPATKPPSSSGTTGGSGNPPSDPVAPETPTAPDTPSTEPDDTAPINTVVTLSWTPPLTRENGTPLQASEIKAYEIYYCKDDCKPEGSGTTVQVPGTPTSYSVTLKEAGTWHFAVAVIDQDDLKSPLSNMVSVEVTP